MTEKNYIVYENWVELGRFEYFSGALLFYRLMERLHPEHRLLMFFEEKKCMTLMEDKGQDILELMRKLNQGGENMDREKESRQMPVKKFIAGAVSAALWSHKTTLKDGRTVDMMSVSLDRSYKDSAGVWQHTGSLKEADLPKAMMVLAKAYEFLTAKPENEEGEN